MNKYTLIGCTKGKADRKADIKPFVLQIFFGNAL